MDAETRCYCYDGSKPFTLSKWKVKIGSQLFMNTAILTYKQDDSTSTEVKDPVLKYKSNVGCTVLELLVSEGDIVQPGNEILKVQPCSHSIIMKDLCAECGADLRQLDRENFKKLTAANTFSMVHVVPELKVNLQQAEKLGKDDETRLLENKKLVLLVDLDQTLIHTTNDNVPKDLPDVHHFQLYGPHSPWYHTKLRPGTNTFLEKISQYYELHICTFGARLYAHKIAKILDPQGKFFSHRILSRDECFDPTSKTGNLKALFPRGDDMVCIIDDREDVWNFSPNVIHVKPYTYFRFTGDINAPPALLPSSNIASATPLGEFSGSTNVSKPSTQVPGVSSVLPDGESNAVSAMIAPKSDERPEKKATPDNPLPENENDFNNEQQSISLIKESQDKDKEPPSSSSHIINTKSENKTLKLENNSSEIVNEKVIINITENTLHSQPNISDNNNESQSKIPKGDDSAVESTSKNALSESEVAKVREVHTSHTDYNDKEIKNTESTKLIDPESCENKCNSTEDKESIQSTNDTTQVSEVDFKNKGSVGNLKAKELTPIATDASDDYLMYLEDILINVHKAYYKRYSKLKSKQKGSIPDLKVVVPSIRGRILQGVNIVFSSIIPTNCVPEAHYLWTMAESLGASVSKDLVLDSSNERTTHVVTSKYGTAKVNAAKKHGVRIVLLDWLLCCAERWEHADERLFPVPKETVDNNGNKDPSLHSPDPKPPRVKRQRKSRDPRNKQPVKSEEEKFSERIFTEAGLSLSQDDIDDMDREIDEACSGESDKESASSASSSSSSSSDSSSVESLSSGDYPRGWKKRRMCESLDRELAIAMDSGSDADTIGSVDEEMAEAVKEEFGDL